MIIAMATNQAYLGTNRSNAFHYQKFNLSRIVFYRNGQPIVGYPVLTTFNHRIYFNTLEALDFPDKGGHGIIVNNYPNHFILAFDITSTQEASHDFIDSELENCLISVQLTFDGALAAYVEILFLGERSSTFYVNSERKVTKTQFSPTPPIDSDEIRYLMGKCIHMKYCFYGIFAADNFPKLTRKGFFVVNASTAQYEGSLWMVILFRENKVYLESRYKTTKYFIPG